MLPIVFFPTSDDPDDIKKTALVYGAGKFRIKPLGYLDIVNILKLLNVKYINN